MTVTKSLTLTQNGDSPDADILMSNVSYMVDQQLVMEYNFNVDTDTSFTVTPSYQRLTVTADYDDTNSTTCLVNARVTTQSTYDKHDDSTVDTTKWTTTTSGSGSASETGNYIRIACSDTGIGSAAFISDGSTTSLDFSGADNACYLYFNITVTNTGSTGTSKFQISDGSNHVDIYSQDTDTGTQSGYLELVFDNSNQQVRVWKEGVENGSSPFDLSALSNYYLRCICTRVAGGADGSSSAATLYRTGKLELSTTYYLKFDNQTESGKCVLYRTVANSALTGQASTTVEASIDDDVSYSSTLTTQIINNLTTFSELKFRISLTTVSSITVSSDGHFGSIEEIYYKYG